MAQSDALGKVRTIDLSSATVSYRERGEGPPVVFVHGVFANADLWRGVVPGIAAAGHRCIAPDWPLGSHEIPAAPDADLSPPGLARMIAEFLVAMDLTDVTLVANDTGGALVQILMASDPARIGRVVLTSSDSQHCFFPPMFGYLRLIAPLPGSGWLLAQSLRIRALHRLPLVYGWLAKRRIPAAIVDSYVTPARRHAGVRRDLRKVLRGVHPRHTMEAAARLPGFDRPVLLAWAEEDRLFPISLAYRLAELLPDARLVPVADSYTFVPEDQPAVLAALITDFTRAPGGRSPLAAG